MGQIRFCFDQNWGLMTNADGAQCGLINNFCYILSSPDSSLILAS